MVKGGDGGWRLDSGLPGREAAPFVHRVQDRVNILQLSLQSGE